MPIKFRCVYCNQLLGISRRKAGTVVRCKTCDGQLVVPDPASAATELAEDGLEGVGSVTKEPPPAEKLFERDDFDKVLEPFQFRNSSAAVASPPGAPASAKHDRPSTPTPIPSPAPTQNALSLDRRQATWAAALIVLCLGLAFAVGLWVGLSLHG